VHDLHVWSLTPGIPLLASHVYLDGTVEPPQVLASLNAYLRGMGIEHSTLQLVDGSSNDMCPCNVPSAGSSSQQLAGGSS